MKVCMQEECMLSKLLYTIQDHVSIGHMNFNNALYYHWHMTGWFLAVPKYDGVYDYMVMGKL